MKRKKKKHNRKKITVSCEFKDRKLFSVAKKKETSTLRNIERTENPTTANNTTTG